MLSITSNNEKLNFTYRGDYNFKRGSQLIVVALTIQIQNDRWYILNINGLFEIKIWSLVHAVDTPSLSNNLIKSLKSISNQWHNRIIINFQNSQKITTTSSKRIQQQHQRYIHKKTFRIQKASKDIANFHMQQLCQ